LQGVKALLSKKEIMDMKRKRAFVYRKLKEEIESEMIYLEDVEDYLKVGWLESPATLIDLKKHGVDPEDPAQVQNLGEAITDQTQAFNGALNLDIMTSKELRAYAKKHFSKKFKGNPSKPTLLAEVKKLVEGE
jgi:hypothetical protein